MTEWPELARVQRRCAPGRGFAAAGTSAALIFLGACMPAPLHGPRVVDGWHGGASLAVPAGPPPRAPGAVTSRDAFVQSPSDLRLAYGFTDENPWHPALLVGAQATPFFLFTNLQADAYLQVPRRLLLGLDAGGGVIHQFANIPGGTIMYSQLGYVNANHTGAYAMAGYLRQRGDLVPIVGLRPNDASVGSIAAQIRLHPRRVNNLRAQGWAQQTLHVFITGVSGHQREISCEAPPCTPTKWRPGVRFIVGAMLENFDWKADNDPPASPSLRQPQ
jgi:hypothetical protein